MSTLSTLSGSLEREAMLKHLGERIAWLKEASQTGDIATLKGRLAEIEDMIHFIDRRQEVCKVELASAMLEPKATIHGSLQHMD